MTGIRHIRLQILGLTQVRFARVCRVGQPTVSRWERGIGGPKHVHLSRMRSFAIRTGVTWDDSFLFAMPSKRTRGSASTQKNRSALTVREAI